MSKETIKKSTKSKKASSLDTATKPSLRNPSKFGTKHRKVFVEKYQASHICMIPTGFIIKLPGFGFFLRNLSGFHTELRKVS